MLVKHNTNHCAPLYLLCKATLAFTWNLNPNIGEGVTVPVHNPQEGIEKPENSFVDNDHDSGILEKDGYLSNIMEEYHQNPQKAVEGNRNCNVFLKFPPRIWYAMFEPAKLASLTLEGMIIYELLKEKKVCLDSLYEMFEKKRRFMKTIEGKEYSKKSAKTVIRSYVPCLGDISRIVKEEKNKEFVCLTDEKAAMERLNALIDRLAKKREKNLGGKRRVHTEGEAVEFWATEVSTADERSNSICSI